MDKKDVFITHGRRPLSQRLIAALFFTLIVYCVYRTVSDIMRNHSPAMWITIAIVAWFLGLRFGTVRQFYFDFKTKRFREEYLIGPIKIGAWEPLPELEYISVFRKGGYFQINMWFKPNQFYNLSTFNDIEIALKQGEEIAKKLQIGLLDAATDPRNSKWVKLL